MPTVTLPTFHSGQIRAYDGRTRFYAGRCGRRFGKTEFGVTIASDAAAWGQAIGYFAPSYKFIVEPRDRVSEILAPIRRSSSKTEGEFHTTTGGKVDFWTLENEAAGRSRKYHGVIIDEAAFTNATMLDQWNKAIRPTLIDYAGWALVLSNTNGVDQQSFFWRVCNDPKLRFTVFHAPSHANPLLPRSELDQFERDMPPLVYQQEILAEFIDWSGVQFFARDSLLVEGQPVEWPRYCDAVLATIDTATKTEKRHDGTACTYWAYNSMVGIPLVVLDWEIMQIEGALLSEWLPTVFANLESMARECGARSGSVGAYIEDKDSGSVLLQHAARNGWPAQPIDSAVTAMGKTARSFNASPYVYQGKVKFSRRAYDKVAIYKGYSRNHLLGQVLEFRPGVDDPKAEDDGLDTFTSGISITLGNSEGF
jgi:hypothetical protein